MDTWGRDCRNVLIQVHRDLDVQDYGELLA